ncbi:MAG: PAS domain S-box protein [Chitinophagales bacterium]|nr:PAS domain S-box protein [Chitinophagales bacterium]
MSNADKNKLTLDPLELLELRKKYEELQLRVTRFSVIEQELIHARNRLDREVMIYRHLQDFNSMALSVNSETGYAQLVAESMIEIFEVEVAFVCIDIPNTGDAACRHIEGYALSEEQKFKLQLYCMQLFTDLPPGTLRSFTARESDKIRAILPLQQVVAIQVTDPQLNITVTLLGGITEKGSMFYEPIGKDREAPFIVFSQHVLGYQSNRSKTQTIREQYRILEQEQKRIVSIAENFLDFDTNPDKNIQKIVDLSSHLMNGIGSVYEKIENDLLYTSAGLEESGFTEKEAGENICFRLTNQSGRDIVCQQITEEETANYLSAWIRRFTGKTLLSAILRIDKKPIGTLAVILDASIPVNDNIFQLIRILSAALTVEERRKNALKALSESEEKYRMIFEGTPNGIIVADPEIQRLQYVNKSACNLFGYTEEEFLSKSLEDLHPPEAVEMVISRFMDMAAGKISIALNIPCINKDHQVFYADIYTNKISFGGRTMLAGFFTDVTRQRQDQQAILKTNIELKKINAELDNFVYSVSHDLRSPLLAILGLVQLINLNQESPVLVNKYIHMISASATRMDDTIKEILEYSRNARLEIRNDEIHFEPLIREIYNDVKHITTDEVRVDLQIRQTTPFYSDLYRINTLFKNIISNAVKYRKKREEASYIRIDVLTDNRQALIRFEDNGEGVEKAHQDRIFDMFYRASNSAPGTGLGLYICKEILNNIDGTIAVESVPGEGTVFTVVINNKKNTTHDKVSAD